MQTIEVHCQPQTYSDSHTSKGNQLKWEQEDCWYKADAFGYESLAETLCSRIIACSSLPEPVMYEPVNILYHDKVYRGCRSKNFKKEGESLVTAERLCRQYTGMGLAKTLARFSETGDRIAYMVDLVTNITGCEDFGIYLTELLEIDAFFLNEDRHTNNIALLLDENTGSYRLCPFFDMGLSLLSDSAGDYPFERDYEQCLQSVQSKPFERDFDEQLDAAEARFGSHLKFHWNADRMCREVQQLKALGIYTKEECDRASWVLRSQARKYVYMMP
jgi:hypothetical protein